MLEAHLPLFYTIAISVALAILILWLGAYLGPRRPTRVKSEPFECGNPASGDARERVNVKYFLVAILFLVFDIEAVFIYPWAVTFAESVGIKQTPAGDVARAALVGAPVPAVLAFGAMLSFVSVIVVALVYAWRKGALDWTTGS